MNNNNLLKRLNKREGSYNLIKLNKKYFKSYNNKKIPKNIFILIFQNKNIKNPIKHVKLINII